MKKTTCASSRAKAVRAARRRRIETRRLYCFEDCFHKELPYYARRDRSIESLRDLATKVWKKHGRKGLAVPIVVDGKGTKINKDDTFSFSLGYGYIELTRSQRTVAVLLHELCHALGYGALPNGHGRGFVRKYVDLLVEFGQCDRGKLLLALRLFNIRV